jgi:hypothetical protein
MMTAIDFVSKRLFIKANPSPPSVDLSKAFLQIVADPGAGEPE